MNENSPAATLSPGSFPLRAWLLVPGWVPAFLALILAAGFALRLFQWSKPLADLFEPYFLTDDGYYAFSYAREFARGHPYQSSPGFPGNGFQPLYVFLITPFFWFSPSDPDAPVRLALLFSIAASMGTCLLLFVWAARLWGTAAGLVAAAVWALSPTAVIHSLNGLETALHLFCIALLGAAWRWLLARPFWMGAMLGLCVLARVDSVLAVPVLLAAALIQSWTRGEHGDGRSIFASCFSRAALGRLALALAGFLAALAPYCASSYAFTGHLTPMSGRGMRNLSLYFAYAEPDSLLPVSLMVSNLKAAAAALKSELLLHLTHGEIWIDRSRFPPLLLAAYAAVALGLAAASRPWKLARDRTLPLALLLAVLPILGYVGYVGGAWFYPRYFHPTLLLPTLILAAVASTVRLPPIRAARAGPLVLFFIAAALSHRVLERKAEAGRFYFHLDWLPKIKRLLEGGRAGMYQSGVVGYYADGGVVNLDGVANEDALEALAEGSIDAYLEKEGIQRVIDWDWIEPPLFRHRSDRNRTYLKLVEPGRFFWIWELAEFPDPARIAAIRSAAPGGLVLLPHDPEFPPNAGWGDPRVDGENLYCWTTGDEPRLGFVAPEKTGRYTVRIHFDRPYPWPEEKAEIGILWPGERAVRRLSVGPGPFTLESKVDFLRARAYAFFQLYIPSTEVPPDQRERPFDRRLGARFLKLEVIPDKED